MAKDAAPQRPSEALRQAVEGAAIGFLGSHPIARFIFGAIGAVFFIVVSWRHPSGRCRFSAG